MHDSLVVFLQYYQARLGTPAYRVFPQFVTNFSALRDGMESELATISPSRKPSSAPSGDSLDSSVTGGFAYAGTVLQVHRRSHGWN